MNITKFELPSKLHNQFHCLNSQFLSKVEFLSCEIFRLLFICTYLVLLAIEIEVPS